VTVAERRLAREVLGVEDGDVVALELRAARDEANRVLVVVARDQRDAVSTASGRSP